MNKKTFTAIDFETAQGYRHTICQVGLVRVVNGIIVKEFNLLVQPPENYYWNTHTDIHGINAETTKYSPFFNEIWEQLRPYIENQSIIAHNIGFDNTCLVKTLEYYGLAIPEYTIACTYAIYRKSLANLCMEYQIELKHHDALSDAHACAQLYLKHLNN